MQDESARREALRSIDENSQKLKSEDIKVQNLEAELEKELKVLEGIQDSLKGNNSTSDVPVPSAHSSTTPRQDPGFPRPDRGQAEGVAALDHQNQCQVCRDQRCLE